jgi:hypothetical protein
VVELTAVAELAAVVLPDESLLLQPAEIATKANEVTAKIEARTFVRMAEFFACCELPVKRPVTEDGTSRFRRIGARAYHRACARSFLARRF